MLRSTRIPWFLIALLFFLGATPESPHHMVRPDRIQAAASENGFYLQAVNGKGQWSPGVGVPVFVDGATTNPGTTGAPRITVDVTTGVITLPSAPVPPLSLQLFVNGLCQTAGRDYILSGLIATPGPDQILADGRIYSPKGAIIEAATSGEIKGNWRR